jgi:hypothetical protein
MSQSTIPCPRCGRPNPFTQVFCSECGAKLDLQSIKKEQIMRPRGVQADVIVRLLKLLVRIAVLAVLVLMVWPVSPRGVRGGQQQLLQMADKRKALISAVQNGWNRVVVFDESEVNAYLAARVNESGDGESAGPRLPLDAANVDFTEKQTTVTVVVRLGPLPLSYEVYGQPEVTGEGFTFKVKGARVGHMPLPGVVASPVARKVKTVFSGLRDDRRLLNNLARMAVGNGAVKVAVGSPQE